MVFSVRARCRRLVGGLQEGVPSPRHLARPVGRQQVTLCQVMAGHGNGAEAYAKLAAGNVATLRQISAGYGNVVTQVQPSTDLAAPEPLDLVWTSQNYHDYADPFMGRPGPESLARAAFRLLKPGGVFIVIDHRAAPGRGEADTDTLHRIDPQVVLRQARAAGFVLAGESKVLANPADPLTIKVFDPKVRGKTSQFAFKFVKPLHRPSS